MDSLPRGQWFVKWRKERQDFETGSKVKRPMEETVSQQIPPSFFSHNFPNIFGILRADCTYKICIVQSTERRYSIRKRKFMKFHLPTGLFAVLFSVSDNSRLILLTTFLRYTCFLLFPFTNDAAPLAHLHANSFVTVARDDADSTLNVRSETVMFYLLNDARLTRSFACERLSSARLSTASPIYLLIHTTYRTY